MMDNFSKNILFTGARLEKEKEYWTNHLQGSLDLSAFPQAGHTMGIQASEKIKGRYEIGRDTSQKLVSMAKGSPYALYMIVLSSFDYLLYKYSGSNTVTVGMPVFVNHKENTSTGNFVLLKNTIDDKATFKELVFEVRRIVTEADKFSNFPYAMIPKLLNYAEDSHAKPYIKTVVALDSIHDLESLQNIETDMIVSFSDKGQCIAVNTEYASSLYDKETIDRIMGNFINLLGAVTQRPDAQLLDFDILAPNERNWMLHELSSRYVPYPEDKTIHQLFEEQVERTPGSIAVAYAGEKLTYRELNNQSNRLARTLREKGVKTDTIVGIMAERSPEMIVGMLAILKAGGAYLPIDPDYPEERIRYMIQDSGTGIILSDKFRGNSDLAHIEFIDLNDSNLWNTDENNLENINKPSGLAYIIYTSGTTGKAKGAMIEHRNVVRLMVNDKMQFDFNSKDVWTMFHSFCFDFSVWEMYGALLYGGKLVIVPKSTAKDPAGYLGLLKEHHVTVLNQTPTAFYGLINEELKTGDKNLSIRYVVFGGEALNPVMLREWREKYPDTKLINMYGITETTVHVTYKEITEQEIAQGISNIGKPIPTLATYIMDSNLKLLPVGAMGELCVGGLGVCRGYLNRPELTAERFAENPYILGERLYRSGDLAKLLPNGDMEYCGRLDHQVKIRGHRIELGEIEHAILDSGLVKEVVAVGMDDSENNKYICAYLVAKKDFEISELRGYLAGKLPQYMLPSYCVRLEKIPLTANNKVDRKGLPRPDSKTILDAEYQPPRNELEEKLAQIWQEVLSIELVGVNSNFFHIGGDSIKAITLIGSMNKAFSADIGMKDIYLNQTIGELAEFIQSQGAQEQNDALRKGLAALEDMKRKILEDEYQAGRLPKDYEDFYPLSPIQQGMVFLARFMPEEPVYHDQFPYIIKAGEFSIDVFNRVIRSLAAKHQILRTTFMVEGLAAPVQVVHKADSGIIPPIGMEDLTALPDREKGERIQDYCSRDLKNKFKFDNDLLWRMRVFKLNETEYCIIFTCQHAIMDGWSVASLVTEILEIYKRLQEGEEPRLQPLKASYKEYVAVNMSRNAMDEVREFWKEALKGYSRNKLPFNISNKKINNTTGSRMKGRDLPPELLKSLKGTANKEGCTLKDICLAAHVLLLNILTTDEEIVTGVVTHDRPVIEDGEKILGCFLNTLPLRINMGRRFTKRELFGIVKDTLRDVKAHELFLSDIAAITGESAGSNSPIFDTLLNYTDFHVMNKLGKMEVTENPETNFNVSTNEMTNTLFDLEVSSTLDLLKVKIKYSPNYFYDADIETALMLYVKILEALALLPGDEYINVEGLLPEEHIHELVYGFNNTKTDYQKEKTMHRLFEEQAEKTPGNTALVFDGRELTYRELNEKSNQLARALMEKGIKSGDNVALAAQRGFEMIIGMLAILKCGGAYVPIDPEYPAPRKKFIMDNSKVSALLADGDYGVRHENTLYIDDRVLEGYAKTNINIKKDSKDLAYIIYTSGSTGVPKGVMIEHHSAVNLISWVNRSFNVNSEDSLLFITSMCFDLSVYDIFGILAAGGKVVIARREQVRNPDELKQLLMQNKITFWDSVPTTMNYLINTLQETHKGYSLESLRLVFMSGDWIPVSLPERLRRHFPNARVISLGGATEGTVWSIYYPIESVDASWTSIPYGKPIDNNCFYILDKDRKVVPMGVAGELYIGGVGVARGYINDEARTKASFVNNRFLASPDEMMYKTGDLGRMLPDGNIEFLGRVDYQVKIRGYRVELGEIDNKLLKNKAVKEAVTVDRTDAEGNKYLCSYIVWNEELGVSEIREYLSGELPDYMIPAYFISIPGIPLTPNGKIDRKALPEPGGEINTGVEYVPPASEMEERLVKVWKEVLGVERIGVNDDFFGLGGHSLKATVLTGKLHREFNIEMPLREVFRLTTVKEQAGYIERAKENIYSSIGKVPRQEYYEVSSPQKRLYILNQFEGNKTVYNMPSIIELEGRLDRDKLNRAFNGLIERHEALRTSFEMKDGEVVQKVYEEVSFAIEYIEGCQEKVRDIAGAFVKPFDLSAAPLIRVAVVKESEDRHILMFDMHHIIADGTSMSILIKEFTSLYAGERLPELRIQYKDFSKWQNGMFKTGEIKKQEAYWLKVFEGEIPVLNMPLDYPRPSVQSFEGAHVDFCAGKELLGGLHGLGARTGATMYMVLLAAYNVLLSKYTGQEDIVVGSPIAGRQHADLDNVMGMFVNTLAMRNRPEGDKTFEKFLREVKENSLNAYENQDYPFEELVEKLDIERDLSRNPLFDTVLVLQNTDRGVLDLGELKIKPYEFENKVSKFDITLNVIEGEEGIGFILEYSTRLYKRETMERIAGHFVNILGNIAKEPGKKLKEIEMLTQKEKEEILYRFNGTCAEYPKDKTIHRLFEEQAEKTPGNIAVVYRGEKLTYSELNKKANQLARVLRKKGVKPDTIVGIMAERSLEMIVGILGILKAGGAYLPIDPDYPEDRVAHMLNDSKTEILLIRNEQWKKACFGGQVIRLDRDEIYQGEEANLENVNGTGNLAYVMYTSGSTGRPKGVMIEHKSVVRLVKNTNYIEFKEEDRILQTGALTFDASTFEIWGALLNGLNLYLVDQGHILDAEKLGEELEKNRISILWLTSSLFNQLAGQDAGIFKALRYLLVGGDVLSVRHINSIRSLHKDIKIINGYGPTENTTFTTCHAIDREYENNIPIGKPINSSSVYIMGNSGNLQPVGVAGELCIAGDGLARGYLNRPELTAEKFVDNPFEPGEKIYRTGDLARWLPDGNIEFLGRIDRQVKIRGYRIELGEIEATLAKLAGIKEAVVIAREDNDGSKYLCAYVMSEERITAAEIRQELMAVLPDYMVPACYIQLESIPLTLNGKVDRKALLSMEATVESDTYEAPGNITEERLVGIWSEILGAERIGIKDNFFGLGGHSLKATTLSARVHKEFNVELPLKEVFNRQTIRELAEYINGAVKGAYKPIEPIEEKEYYEVSSAQKRLYILNRLEGNKTVYNLPSVIELEGRLDREKLSKAFNELIERHEALRTSFEMKDGEVVQRIHGKVPFAIEYIKDSENPEKIVGEFIRPFDLSQAPLIRAAVAKTGEDRHILMFDMHHIISDGTSMGILIKEFTSLYSGNALPGLRIQYKDFSKWQNDLFKTEEIKKQEKYWLDMYEGEIPVLNMPLDFSRPPEQSFEGAVAGFGTGRELLREIRELGARTGSTMYMVLLAAYNVLLHKYTGQEDIIVGSPIAGRQHADLDNVIGMFVNTLAMRNKPAGDKTFEEFLKEVKENALNAYENQNYQFEELVGKLGIERDLSRNALFDTMFVLQNTEQETLALGGLKLRPYEFENKVAKLDMTLNAVETGEGIAFSLEYCTTLYTRETIGRFTRHFITLLENVVKEPRKKIADIGIMTGEEQERILYGFNNTAAAYPRDRTIHRLFEEQAERTPDSIAAVFEDEKLTYRELNNKSNQLARVLREKGVKGDTIVGIMVERSLEMMVGILGILKAGGAYLPIDPHYPEDRIKYMLEDSNTDIVLTKDSLKKELQFAGQVIALDDRGRFENIESGNIGKVNNPDSLAYVIYTSGSTGKPKGVMIEHYSLINRLNWVNRKYPIDESDVILQKTPYTFDVSLWELFWWSLAGARVCFLSPGMEKDPGAIVDAIERNKVTTMHFVPSMLGVFLEHVEERESTERLRSLKKVFASGEALSVNHVKSFNRVINQKLGTRLYNLYGPTEAAVDVTYYDCPAGQDIQRVPIGKPIDNIRMYIVDKFQNLTPIGVAGELCIAGDGLARGYLNRPELTAEKFVPNPFEPGRRMYRTGDLARWLPDGNIEFLGRIDHQVKIRGYRIELGEIEALLLKHDKIKEAVVDTREDKNGIGYLCAYYTSNEDVMDSELRGYLKKDLPEYLVPSYFVPLESIPLTQNGKADRKALRRHTVSSSKKYAAPVNEVEEKLVGIWKELLNNDFIGTEDNLFSIGGHSLLVVQMVSRVEEVFKKRISVASVFKHSTIKELARALEEGDGNVSLIKMNKGGSLAPFFCIHSGLGEVFNYVKLAEKLSPEIPFYAIRCPGLEDGQNIPGRIEDFAKLYIGYIKEVQPEGPYHLGGFCTGGGIAYEIAHQLVENGDRVSLLAMFNTYNNKTYTKPKHNDEAHWTHDYISSMSRAYERPLNLTEEDFRKLSPEEQLGAAVVQLGSIGIKYTREQVVYAVKVFKANTEAYYKYYRLKPYGGGVHFFGLKSDLKSRITNQRELWRSLIKGEFTFYEMEGTHFGILKNENLDKVANVIRKKYSCFPPV